VYLTGHTWGDYGTWQFAKNDIMDYYSDFLAVKLNLATGKQIWAIQDQVQLCTYAAVLLDFVLFMLYTQPLLVCSTATS
jgi:hypothetical protein